ncbi:MAG TPA: bacteriocin-protection protein [Sphingobacteriaceae bacterium]|nr:bacteriocin-protection protein [Sphingobacteriaceae bacterium]
MTETQKPVFFETSAEFRKWLAENHQIEKELLVGFHKIGSGKPSMTWSESVDQALCHGWINGVRKSMGDESYTIRFTPRKPSIIWSSVNIKKIEELTQKGLMQPAGIESFKKRSEKKSGIYSHENELKTLDDVYEKKFKSNKKAWDFFQAQAPSYKKVVIHLIMTAKQEKTRLSRLEGFMKDSEAGKRSF